MARKPKNESNDANTEVSGDAASKRDVFRMADNATITYGVDKEGNALSSENSPKKSDATKGRWALYRDGMTVSEALAAGLTRSNIRKDRRAGYVRITNPEPTAAEASAE